MESLTDDVLIRILSYLDINSQQIMLNLHPRFFNLMPIVWISQYKKVKMSLFEAKFSIDDLRYFFKSISKTVQVMHLRMMSAEQYMVLLEFIFPKVYDFRFATVPSRLLSDSDIPKLIMTFPNLKEFSPQGSFSGRYFTDFPLLERLTLTYCQHFSVENLANVMKVRKLKEIKLCLFDRMTIQKNPICLPADSLANLESIKVEIDELPWFEDHLETLDCLSELTISGPGLMGILPVLCRKLGSITEKHHFKILETCNTTDTLCTVIESKLRVDKLKIVTDNYLLEDLGYFSPSCFEYLNQLFFKSCCIQEKRYFNNLMHNIANIELVSFEQCVFTFDNYQFIAAKIGEKRKKLLQVNLFQNTCVCTRKPWIYSKIGEHPLLEFIEGKNYDYTFEPIYMTFN
ncbi:PREDICTED: uncharacterized protein LOC108615368 [Drosophila arizonae]|uniref:Uncharacterized protein LOC108615368 n=1 Tax=Drosophila arizonae TaxID=7263 RepID=A0ABM1PDM0_DROAR|nr:PREDICTED: uncharacterized protein LOC108615368 [Drosophila arizonae]